MENDLFVLQDTLQTLAWFLVLCAVVLVGAFVYEKIATQKREKERDEKIYSVLSEILVVLKTWDKDNDDEEDAGGSD